MTWFIWLATEPYEALPLGSGQLGVLMRNQGGITWLFNHGSFFANAVQDNDLISSGEFSLQRPDDWRAGFVEERLVLHDAMLVTRYKTGADLHTVKSWLAEGLDLIVVEIESTAALPDLTATVSVWELDLKPQAAAHQADISLATVGMGGHRVTAIGSA